LLLLALPLAVAVWSLGSFTAGRQRHDADQRLVNTLGRTMKQYVRESDHALAVANRLAASRAVQRAFQRGPQAIERLRRAHPGVLFLRGKSGGAIPANATPRRVDVLVGPRTVGRVIVLLPLDGKRLAGLARAVELREGQRLAFLVGERLILERGSAWVRSRPALQRPVDLRLGASKQRAVALSLPELGSRNELVTLESSSRIAAAADRARWRVVAVGFALIAALLGLAYAVAPAIARSRVTRQQRDQAERVLTHLGDGVVVVDHEGVVQLWNPAAEAITGLRAADVRNRLAKDTIPGWATIAALVPVASGPAHGDEISSVETVPVAVDGRELWLSMVAVALADGTVYAFRDATDERRLEDLRSQFVATISHELRTPLASLHGAALTLREHGRELNPQTHDNLLAMIAEQSKRLADLVEEILVAGQLDSGSLRVWPEPFDPEELVRGAAMIARARVGEETTISVSIEPVLPRAQGDVERTRQVLLNLLDNAVKYSPRGGRIDVGAAAADDGVRFTVRDEGLGIPAGEEERIFDKFYRLDPDQRGGIGGTGLGLYICRELVRSMGGRIWVESDPDEGTVFSFELPAAERLQAAV
jgi:PAS domain S-box-containing protein